VLIVDDHPAVREALAVRISRSPDLEVCGEAADLTEALHLIDQAPPDVAVIDISLKKGDGIELIKRIKYRDAGVRMLVWSMHSESLYAERALRAGALGYITKEQATDRIVDAIRHVLSGQVYMSSHMTQEFLRQAVGAPKSPMNQSPLAALSDRELEVFRLIGEGHKTRDIALQLHLSVKTVETYRDRIRDKLNLSDSAEVARVALQWVLEGE
jgi:DNA-binding NarL/FixJ family response regulator